MINFVWKHKYKLLSLIILCFIFSIFTLKNPKIFYDSERILQYADGAEIEQEANINSSNLFLVGVEYDNKIIFDDLIKLQSVHQELIDDENIALSQSVFNDISLFDLNFFLPFFITQKIENKKDFNVFIEKIEKKGSLFI
jgi:hypothetical protein